MSGRRPGKSTTRQQLLEAARELFSARGDDATTREIAERAGVDPAMIAHYFGSKGALFELVTSFNIDPADVIAPVLEADPERAAAELVDRLVRVWDAHASAASTLLRTATRSQATASRIRGFLLDRAVRPVVSRFSPDPAEVDTRAALLASQVAGLLLTRYVLRWEPLASADRAWVVQQVAPTVHHYLRDPLATITHSLERMQTVIQYSRFGGPEVLEVAENPDPTPGEGKVLIEVKAVGVNPIDWKLRQGIRPSDPIEKPRRLGNDAAGVIAALGPGAAEEGWTVGDEVVVSGASGAYTNRLVASVGKLVRKPAGVPFEQAAALGIPAGTAYQAVASLGVGEQDVLLIHGASGAVGQAAIQFARARDVVVVGTAGRRNLERLRELDAIPLEYGDGLVERVREAVPRVDYVLDMAGTEAALQASLDLVADRSHIGTIVAGARAAELGIQAWSGGSPVPLTPEQEELRVEGLRVALNGLADRTFQVEVGLVLPLTDAAEAHRLSQLNQIRGKIILVP